HRARHPDGLRLAALRGFRTVRLISWPLYPGQPIPSAAKLLDLSPVLQLGDESGQRSPTVVAQAEPLRDVAQPGGSAGAREMREDVLRSDFILAGHRVPFMPRAGPGHCTGPAAFERPQLFWGGRVEPLRSTPQNYRLQLTEVEANK